MTASKANGSAETAQSNVDTVLLITDGACLGNPGPGGWAALLRYKDREKLIVGGEKNTTNNRMELTAVCEGLKALSRGCAVKIRIDSQYVMKGFVDGWLVNWQKRGWRTADGKPVKNKELWQELLTHTARHTISWEWVRGHAGDPDNERVDQAAREAATALKS